MKEIIVLLLILIQLQVLSEVELENKLIGTWKIEKVQVTRPGVCLQDNFSHIVGVTFRFEEEQHLLITSNSEWF